MQNTKQLIADAFIALLSSKPLEGIKVHEITEKAGISKATFYRLFSDKYDVMQWIIKSKIEEIVSIAPDMQYWDTWVDSLLQYFFAHKDYYRQLVTYQGQNSFPLFFTAFASELTLKKLCAHNEDISPEDIAFSVSLYTAGCTHMICQWLLGGCKTPIPSLVSSIMESIPMQLVPYIRQQGAAC